MNTSFQTSYLQETLIPPDKDDTRYVVVFMMRRIQRGRHTVAILEVASKKMMVRR